MSMSDPIADMLTRIRNSILRKHEKVKIPFSNLKESIAKVLLSEGFINGYQKIDSEKNNHDLVITLKYESSGEPVIRNLRRVSKPGLRVHKGYQDLKPLLNGQGIYIISTSKGLFSDFVCRKQQIGGEVFCAVY